MINFDKASFKDFENIEHISLEERAKLFSDYLDYLFSNGKLNYRLTSYDGCKPSISINVPLFGKTVEVASFVSNDYLGLTQNEEVKNSIIEAVMKFGAGSAASPAIGGHFIYHEMLENKLANFFEGEDAILYNTGYTANSATFQALLNKEDLAILDMAVHASIYEGCQLTNVKTFLHNNIDMLERILINTSGKYRTRMIILDGVYSQDGDIALLDKIIPLAKEHGAMIAVDDAHGIGVLGDSGRGVVEVFDAFRDIDLFIGTLSKSIGNLGGFVVGKKSIMRYLKFQSKQHLFSTTSTPSILGAIKALEIIETDKNLRNKLWNNINYFKNALIENGFEVGNSESAVIPVKIGDIHKTLETGKILLENGVHANPIMYPAVAKKDARIRFNLTANHEVEHLDKAVNALLKADNILNIKKVAYG
ncbi:aminotransferase class I/II-fold pyridoxal phosphate-dependent enzyme [Belliella sp. DSM 111904]|uniref:Aminotransferase class I/II-fold pyridoxal phosphate-dependent enzyme n=1 Tax=Belliella filtrata TaxID=2923435 RepID=A0ABS9V775_9BACT|nr:aminotransferase class I/II-fold pyridoxal phosphate-dependent enzyme [Belliella filtrata]MCH7411803.1 aminotransferase class I/II-fold pyridoxal phosphate-dependent enzyme [Belliella filtrata]